MEIKKLQYKTDVIDYKDCYALWSDCFGDSKQYMDFYFEEKTKDNQIFVLKEENKLLTMVQLNPYTISVKGRPATLHYIVGVATRKEARSKGYMRKVLTRSMESMREAGEIATYLMPAAKEIYLPYDFRYCYTQERIAGKPLLGINGTFHVRKFQSLLEEEKQKALSFANGLLSCDFSFYTEKTKAYYERQCLEMQAAGGDVVALYEEGEIRAIVSYMFEQGSLEIVETITRPKYAKEVVSSFLAYVRDNGTEEIEKATWYETHFLHKEGIKDCIEDATETVQPIIMARILNAKKALETMSLIGEEPLTLVVEVEDGLLQENSRTYKVVATKEKTSVEVTEEPFDVKLGSDALSQYFFHSVEVAQLEIGMGKLSKEQAINKLIRLEGCKNSYINEIV